MEYIREATNKAWVIGSDCFKDKVGLLMLDKIRLNQEVEIGGRKCLK